MPYAMCPICGSTMHLNVSDPASWYAERHPDAVFGGFVPEPCPGCFLEVCVGDAVRTRRLVNDNHTIEPNQRGTIKAVYCNKEFGNLFVVSLESGKDIVCPRQAIRKPFDGEA